MQQRRREDNQVQDHYHRILQEPDETGPRLRAMLQGENSVNQLNAEPDGRNRRAFTQDLTAPDKRLNLAVAVNFSNGCANDAQLSPA